MAMLRIILFPWPDPRAAPLADTINAGPAFGSGATSKFSGNAEEEQAGREFSVFSGLEGW